MQINFNLDLNKMRQQKKQDAKTGMSMQATVNSALNLPQNNAKNQQIPPMNNPNGWGANAQ